MAVPTTRETFRDHCLRRLGAPVLDINVDNEQVEDRIDEALRYYHDYHYDGSERIFIRHQVAAEDKTNKYITIPENVFGIAHVLPIGSTTTSSGSFFNVRYQIHLNDLFDLSSSSYVTYYMAMQHIAMLEELFVGQKIIRYNRHVNKLHIDMDWDNINVGEYIIIDCYSITDPNTYTDVWADRWLQRYCSELIKRQWGQNLIKFEGMQLPGGVTFNGQKIHDDAMEQIAKLEEEMIVSYSLPVHDLMG